MQTTDANGTVHGFDDDMLGRPVSDRVVTLGTDVDGAVRRIDRAYEVCGMLRRITSYDAVLAGDIVNEVERTYNAFAQVLAEYQSHFGAADCSPYRRLGMHTRTGVRTRYGALHLPTPASVTLSYEGGSNGGMSDVSSRLEAIKESSNSRVTYAY